MRTKLNFILTATELIIITLNSQVLPDYINIGYERVKVRPYIIIHYQLDAIRAFVLVIQAYVTLINYADIAQKYIT